MSIFIFAYGSLMCPESCFRTLQRKIEYKEAILKGYSRIFNATGTAYSEKLNQHIKVRFANLIRNENSQCSGLLFEIDEIELKHLQVRESFYSLIDISDKINLNLSRVYTFICEQPNTIDGVILKRYLNIMSQAVENFPNIKEQINNEFLTIKSEEILDGGFIGVSGQYK